VRGSPRLELKAARTRVRQGGIAFLERPVRRIGLRPGRRATVLVAAGDVPVGSETTCPSSRTLLVEPRGSARAVHVHVHIRACGRGLLRESPFLRGVRSP
jgi:hypothetical protein